MCLDQHSGYIMDASTTKEGLTAPRAAELLYRNGCTVFGPRCKLISEKGSAFMRTLFNSLSCVLTEEHTAYHPQHRYHLTRRNLPTDQIHRGQKAPPPPLASRAARCLLASSPAIAPRMVWLVKPV